MIKDTKEFRLGNMIRWDTTDFKLKHGLEEAAVNNISIDRLNFISQDSPCIEPLPITKYRLQRLGFQQHENWDLGSCPFANVNLSYWANDCILLFYNQNDVDLNKEYPEQHQVGYLGGFGFQHGGLYFAATFRWIHYIHEVQNLFQAIRGKELTLKQTNEKS